MARIDFRVQPGFFRHPKTICMREACGQHAVLCLLQLWAHAAENAPDGNLDAMSDASIEIAAGWIGQACEKGKFIAQLRNSDSLYLDGKQLHDWQEHQPFLSGHKERSKKAQHAARMRWACSADAKPCGADAPSPSPSPSPPPFPSPSPPPADSSKPEAPVAPPLDFNQKREMDWLLKAVRLMVGRSRTFQADLMSNGDLEVKFTKWSRESGGIRWIIFCAGIMWRRVEVYNDGLNDPFACAKPKAIDSPMSYWHSLVFPEKNGHQANFMAGEVAFREERSTEFWFRTFWPEWVDSNVDR